jgi:two-component system phosphate regulon sensor histidine kinase PhoR
VTNYWLKEVYRLAIFIAIAAAVGWFFDSLWPTLCLVMFLYIAWTLYQLKGIRNWLADDSEQYPPESLGLWGEIYDKLYSLQKQQVRIQQHLEAEVQYLRDSFASLSDAVVMTNPQGAIVWCNISAKRFLGLRLPKDEGTSVLNLLRDPGFVEFYESGDYSHTLEIVAPGDQGRRLEVEITLFGKGNRLIFARDVTDLHHLEKMRQDFVSNASHELRTPLTVISGYIENFLMLPQPLPNIEKPLQQMRQHAARMESLIRDLLELSRLETMPDEMHKTVVPLGELAQSVVEEAQASLADTEQRVFDVEVDKSIRIYGKRFELHSALLNLVVNACKYTHNNGHISVRCYQDDEGAHFVVKDDGIGIDPQHIPRLTERFYRTDSSRSINTGGTGLGLAIVKHILMRHEATLQISSDGHNKGSTFGCHFQPHRVETKAALSSERIT